ncbi:MAG: histidinol-phosphate transaminase [Peptococcaceae bacterium]|nr:histidinol-phosphate transaminase [Peptococcaceae bacterium]
MRISERFKDRAPYSPGGSPCPVILNANESFVLPSMALMDDFHAIMDDCAFNRYPDPRAKDLCQAFADFYGVDWQQVTAGNGSDELIELLFACLVAPGDRVVTVEPDFSMYGAGAYMNGVEQFIYQQEDYRINVDHLLAFAKEKDAAMLIFSNPCNPTGVVLPREDVLRILNDFDGIVVVDEAYMDFADESVLDLAGIQENLIVLKTCSKALGMAGLRVGFAITTPELTNYLQVGKPVYNVSRLTQALATCVLRHDAEVRAAIETINASTQDLVDGLAPIVEESDVLERMLPTATNFVYILTDKASDLFELMQTHGVLVRQPQKNALRINCGTQMENEACLSALRASLKELD